MMRPDTRSFSFTWLRGQQHTEELNLGRPNTRSQTVGRGQTSNVLTGTSILDNPGVEENELDLQPGSSTGGLSLRRFGSSFLRNVTNTKKYTSIGEVEDEDDMEPELVEGVDKFSSSSLKGEHNLSGSTGKSTLSLGKRLNKTVQDVKNTLGSISQVSPSNLFCIELKIIISFRGYNPDSNTPFYYILRDFVDLLDAAIA